ncbi:MAG: hypothetical protein Q4C36_03950 [Coriobacteriia bacterium]|nr:hypothetical protein [Coriobacteriia bacterium]
MDTNSILLIVGIVVVIGVAGATVFGVIKLRELLGKMDTEYAPKLNELKEQTAAVAVACEQAGPIMDSVNVTLDAVDTELVNLDEKLDKVSNLTGGIVGTAKAIPEVASEAKETIKAGFKGKR